MEKVSVQIKQLDHALDLPLPQYATDGSAGMDLTAAVRDPIQLLPGERVLIPAGVAIALPAGLEAQIRPRSGLALKHGITVLNTPGTVDADYRGEIGIILINLGSEPFIVERGMRIAQMVICEHKVAYLELKEMLPGTDRDQGGFGSTGSITTVQTGT